MKRPPISIPACHVALAEAVAAIGDGDHRDCFHWSGADTVREIRVSHRSASGSRLTGESCRVRCRSADRDRCRSDASGGDHAGAGGRREKSHFCRSLWPGPGLFRILPLDERLSVVAERRKYDGDPVARQRILPLFQRRGIRRWARGTQHLVQHSGRVDLALQRHRMSLRRGSAGRASCSRDRPGSASARRRRRRPARRPR